MKINSERLWQVELFEAKIGNKSIPITNSGEYAYSVEFNSGITDILVPSDAYNLIMNEIEETNECTDSYINVTNISKYTTKGNKACKCYHPNKSGNSKYKAEKYGTFPSLKIHIGS